MRLLRFVDRPDQTPGTCLRCLSGPSPQRTYFLDTGIDLEFGGVIFFCNLCLNDFIKNAPDMFTKEYVDKLVNDERELIESATKAIEDRRKLDKALEAIGLDAAVLLENAGKVASDLEKVPELEKELAQKTLDVQMQRVLTTDAQAKLEALSQYIGAEDELLAQKKLISELTLERDKLLQAKELLEETATRMAQELYAPPVNDEDAEIEENEPLTITVGNLSVEMSS